MYFFFLRSSLSHAACQCHVLSTEAMHFISFASQHEPAVMVTIVALSYGYGDVCAFFPHASHAHAADQFYQSHSFHQLSLLA
jgi:hypothetical protein